MVYVMSDIHGEYERYRNMLHRIGFGKEDTLYILGDVLDRGPEPIRLLQDIAARDNVFLIQGNHELVALSLLQRLMERVTDENCEAFIMGDLPGLLDWCENDGWSTLREFRRLNMDERLDVLDFLQDLPLYETVDVGERTFVLVHATLKNFDEKRPLRSYSAGELLIGGHDYDRRYFSDPSIFIVTGHMPTKPLTGRWEIYHNQNNICVDCGAVFEGGKLACLCLDTMEEFYE